MKVYLQELQHSVSAQQMYCLCVFVPTDTGRREPRARLPEVHPSALSLNVPSVFLLLSASSQQNL